MAIEIVDFPIKNGESFHCKMLVHQRVHEFTIFGQQTLRLLEDHPHGFTKSPGPKFSFV